MRRILALLLTLMMCVCCYAATAEDITEDIDEETWFMSDDGMVEIRLVSFEEDTYPNFKMRWQLRLDGETLSDPWRSPYDLSAAIEKYVSNNPSYQNRKVPISTEDKFHVFRHLRGTMYEATLIVYAGKDNAISLTLNNARIDLARIFPDEFVNYDVIRATSMLKEIKKAFYNPDSMKLRSTTLYISDDNPDIQYFCFELSGQVQAGGTNIVTNIARYDDKTGDYLIYDVTSENLIATNYRNTGNLELDILVQYMDKFKGYHSYKLTIDNIP